MEVEVCSEGFCVQRPVAGETVGRDAELTMRGGQAAPDIGAEDRTRQNDRRGVRAIVLSVGHYGSGCAVQLLRATLNAGPWS